MKTKKVVKRKSKGKRHTVHAESLDRMANELGEHDVGFVVRGELAQLFRSEAQRLRSILR